MRVADPWNWKKLEPIITCRKNNETENTTMKDYIGESFLLSFKIRENTTNVIFSCIQLYGLDSFTRISVYTDIASSCLFFPAIRLIRIVQSDIPRAISLRDK